MKKNEICLEICPKSNLDTKTIKSYSELPLKKLKEAEKAAFTKEDGRRERWKKPTYSDRAHSSQESGKSDLVKYILSDCIYITFKNMQTNP